LTQFVEPKPAVSESAVLDKGWALRADIMTKDAAQSDTNARSGELAVNTPVLVHPGTANQQGGVIVEDFGEFAGQAVDVGTNRIVGAARRWAVRLNSGEFVFVDTHQLRAL
jgi:hypothetical protein